MWTSGKTTIIALLREQNSLLRELIQAVSNRQALTPKTPVEGVKQRIRTHRDITTYDPHALEEQERVAREAAALGSAPPKSPTVAS